MMVRDFGPGLTVDELIGLPAWHILHQDLPPGVVFETTSRAASVMVDGGLESHSLVEIWEDGYTAWQSPGKDKPVVVTPAGLLIRSQD